ncbi:hypothetical protein TNCV_831241 [Trichonephila clavipes]|nr:hypothetical protein TNCV_831241 [Trichonephila clavipes]
MTSSLGVGNTLGTFLLGRSGRKEGVGRLFVSLQITVGCLCSRKNPQDRRKRISPTRGALLKAAVCFCVRQWGNTNHALICSRRGPSFTCEVKTDKTYFTNIDSVEAPILDLSYTGRYPSASLALSSIYVVLSY